MTEQIVDLLLNKNIKDEEYRTLYNSIIISERLSGLQKIYRKLEDIELESSHKIIYTLGQHIFKTFDNFKKSNNLDGHVGVGINLSDNFTICYEIAESSSPKKHIAYFGVITHKNVKINFKNEQKNIEEYIKSKEYTWHNNNVWWYFSWKHTSIVSEDEAEKIAGWIKELYDYFKDKID